ncbi:hypothetical protein COBT_002218 [Conglomerata obtusa]
MKQKLEIEIFKIKPLKDHLHTQILNYITQDETTLTTFNQLMAFFEKNPIKQSGILFVCNNDTAESIMYQHLVLFADYYELPLYSFRKNTRCFLEIKTKIKNVYLIFIMKEHCYYKEMIALLLEK